jgi:hypothetical protein
MAVTVHIDHLFVVGVVCTGTAHSSTHRVLRLSAVTVTVRHTSISSSDRSLLEVQCAH